MKKLLLATAIAGSVLTFSAMAESDHSVSANVGVFTNYVWRGLTQTDDGAAVQGGFDYAHASGLYAGIWASNVDNAGDMEFEYDFYGGFSGEAGELGYDVGVISYHYTIEDSDPTQELYLGVTFKDFGLTYYQGITSDENDKSSYIDLSADFDLDVAALGLRAGFADNDGETANDFAVTVSKDDFEFAQGHEFGLTLTKFSEDLGDGEDDVKALAYWTKSFDF